MVRWGAPAIAVLVVLAGPSVVGADTIRPGDVLTLTSLGAPGDGNAVARVHNNSIFTPDFITFCLESQSPGLHGQFLVNQTGNRAFDGGGDPSDPPPGDPISPQTAFLYYSFRTGVWGPPDFVDLADLALIQRAIYCLENETDVTICSTPPPNPFYAFALTTTWTDIGPVRVMVLVDPGTLAPQQDRLYLCDPGTPGCVPEVPEPGTMLLLGSGLVGLAAVVRRRRSGRRS